MSDTPKPPVKDAMASRAPAHVLSERDETKGPQIEVTASYENPVSISSPGPGLDGLILNHRNYITPEEGKDYRFCTNDNRRVGRNRAKGWKNVKVDGRDIVVGNMTLCERPTSLGDQYRAMTTETALRQAHRASADVVTKSNPGLSGSERKETVTRSDM